ncbi:hydrogenase maturation nickel metallochaperone HypA/HybF [Halodesulfurarchaeum sp.]|uniref:hydrogenase maturation nickel metallochaperone HypA/HybF n=1 Tax=Halodesulfurarchaeum sp. TaxID=1980530 RepID=UPI001BC480E6|nr:hydrogenase maturation nickel metallochaperone HypA [Halodesulfurarchaeum sp.]
MHEISIAKGILDRALEAADAHGADRIDELTLEIGRVTHVNPEQLEFCLEAITESTPAADATIRTQPVEPVAACDCGWRDTPDELALAGGFAPDIKCPECGNRAELVSGRECRLSSIEVPDETTMDRPATRAENPQ